MDNETKKLLAKEVMGWEHLIVGYFGGLDETARQVELEEWMEGVGISSVGEYFIDIENDWWVMVDEWSPDNNFSDAFRLLCGILGKPGFECVDLRWMHGKWGVMEPFGNQMKVIRGSVDESLTKSICKGVLEIANRRNS